MIGIILAIFLDQKIRADAPLISNSLNDKSKRFFEEIRNGLEKLNISYVINERLVRGLDYYIHTAFEYGVADLQILKERIKEDLKKELLFKKRSLPKKKKKLSLSRTKIEKVESNPEDPEQRQVLKYYESIEAELIREIENHSERLKELEELLPQVKKSEIKLNLLLNHLVVFARGGYGRAELSFASDRDLGYCLDTQQLSVGESEICRQFIVHIEHLLREAGIETAHQYFCLLYTSPSTRD